MDSVKTCTRCKKDHPLNSFQSDAKPSLIMKWCARCRVWSRKFQQTTKGHLPLDEYQKPDGWCFGCKTVLAISEFYSTPSQKRGYSTLCKSCTKNRNKIKNKEFKERLKSTEHGRERLRKLRSSSFRNIMADPDRRTKLYARLTLQRAVKVGKIIRKPCEVCGKHETEGHHSDYSKPFDVIWLCRVHHQKAHRQT